MAGNLDCNAKALISPDPDSFFSLAQIVFSPDGRFLLLNSREGFLGLMDSFTGAITSTYAGVSNDKVCPPRTRATHIHWMSL
jgi:hypothetical protein